MLHDIKSYAQIKKNTHFFLNLAKSGRSGQYLTGTGPEPDLKKWPDRPEPEQEPDFRSHTDQSVHIINEFQLYSCGKYPIKYKLVDNKYMFHNTYQNSYDQAELFNDVLFK